MSDKRTISGFLVGEKGSRTQAEKPEIFKSENGRSYVICVLEGGVDTETGEITPEDVQALGLPEDQLKLVKKGMKIKIQEQQ